MFYDLNVPWTSDEAGLQRTIAFLDELGYNVLALSHTLSGKLPADLSCAIPSTLPFTIPSKTRLLRRCTLVISDPSQNHRLTSLGSNYDILALRPTNEKSLQLACQSLDCDLISLDLTVRFDFYFKMKTLAAAVERGIKFEICYSSGIMATDSNARRNLISNASQLIRATRGRGLVISSEAHRAVGCRGPSDVINLAAIWGLGQEKGTEAVSKLARSVVVTAQMRRTSFRGVVDVIYGGEKPEAAKGIEITATDGQKKRKADAIESSPLNSTDFIRPISKREQKRQKKAGLDSRKNAVPENAIIPAEIPHLKPKVAANFGQ